LQSVAPALRMTVTADACACLVTAGAPASRCARGGAWRGQLQPAPGEATACQTPLHVYRHAQMSHVWPIDVCWQPPATCVGKPPPPYVAACPNALQCTGNKVSTGGTNRGCTSCGPRKAPNSDLTACGEPPRNSAPAAADRPVAPCARTYLACKHARSSHPHPLPPMARARSLRRKRC
jgi:hypothetical protein